MSIQAKTDVPMQEYEHIKAAQEWNSQVVDTTTALVTLVKPIISNDCENKNEEHSYSKEVLENNEHINTV